MVAKNDGVLMDPMFLYCSLCFFALNHVVQSAFVPKVDRRKEVEAPFSRRKMSRNAAAANDTAMLVIFGRAGAGKTSVADAAIELLSTREKSLHCVGLDLDVCVPQWMRDNFGRGRYPTLQEREVFAKEACDYVDADLLKQSILKSEDQKMVTIVSFSFVNTDMRDIFRSRFPNSVWLLVDTSQSDADERIKRRENHFYKGDPSRLDSKNVEKSDDDLLRDNTEWNFAPVSFPHTVLPGHEPIEANAERIVDIVQRETSEE